MSEMFSQGLARVYENLQNRTTNEFADYLFKPEDGTKYQFRFLAEEDGFVIFKEHSYIPVMFPKSDGSKVQGHVSFFCKGTPDCPVCKTKTIDPKTGVEKNLRPRDLMAIPIYVIESKKPKRGKGDEIDPVERPYILALPGGKNKTIWKQVLDASDLRKTLTDRDYILQRSGKGMDTVWSIQSLDPSTFDYNEVEPLNVEEVLKNSGRWKLPDEVERLQIVTDEAPSSNNIANNL